MKTKHYLTKLTALISSACCLLTLNCHATDFVFAVENGNKNFGYARSLLEKALKAHDPSHTLTTVDVLNTTQGRIIASLGLESSGYNVAIGGLNKTNTDYASQINIPLTRGLLGYRLFTIHNDDYALFESIQNLDALKEKVSVGSGYQWLDTDVFKHNGFRVEVAMYSQLWKMLAARRYNGFNRGVFEAFREIEMRREQFPELSVYPDLIVKYKFDYVFFVARQDHLRHRILTEALTDFYASGQFIEHFYNHPQIQDSLSKLNPDKLRVFELENPFIKEFEANIPSEYWLDTKEALTELTAKH